MERKSVIYHTVKSIMEKNLTGRMGLLGKRVTVAYWLGRNQELKEEFHVVPRTGSVGFSVFLGRACL